jgi:peptidoglycan-N-acetylglucosamine deacetylase
MSTYGVVSTIFFVVLLLSLSLEGIFSFSYSWYGMWISLYLLVSLYGVLTINRGYFIPVRKRITTRKKVVVLTFSGLPNLNKVERLLEILNKNSVQALFFFSAGDVEKQPELIKTLADASHYIGLMGWTDQSWLVISGGRIIEKFSTTLKKLHALSGKRVKYYRHPVGITTPMIARALNHMNLIVISDVKWRGDGKQPFEFHQGDIIHVDLIETGTDALENMIKNVIHQGFTFCKIDEGHLL